MDGKQSVTFLAVLFSTLVMLPGGSFADPLSSQTNISHRREANPWLDDANLHDVRFVGSRNGWAVGDRGVIRATNDGGRTWKLQDAKTKVSLQSACFLTSQVGWIAGGKTEGFTGLGAGLVLFTQDGGETWKQISKTNLPALKQVQFFSLKSGIAVGEATSDRPTGLFVTKDGGQTWHALPGKLSPGWLAADFAQPEMGIVAGQRGEVAILGGLRLLPTRIASQGRRGIHDVLTPDENGGWMVGDGGLILRTENGGISWDPVSSRMPRTLKDISDFRAVAARGEKVWVAGEPGSVIWFSPNAGKAWYRQFTRQTTPLNALHFSSDTTGYAVGDLGLILRTEDGGQTWQAVRGGKRRVAMLSLTARTRRIPFAALSKYSGELGYRSLTLLPVRREFGNERLEHACFERQLYDAVVSSGGSAARVDWQFPIDTPGLDRDQSQLLTDWRNRSENRLQEVFIGKLVARIRAWRPSILILDAPANDDFATRIINEGILQAVTQAADPTRFTDQTRYANLEAWPVQRVYVRLPDGSNGQVNIDSFEILPRMKSFVKQVATDAVAHLPTEQRPVKIDRESFRLIALQEQPGKLVRLDRPSDDIQQAGFDSPEAVNAAMIGNLFSGIALKPGGPARRPLLSFQDGSESRKHISTERNIEAILDSAIDDPRRSAQMIAHLRQMTIEMPPEQAARLIAETADRYRDASRWNLAEDALQELIARYPKEPISPAAMQKLLHLWIGAEPAWHRVQEQGVQKTTIQPGGTLSREMFLNQLQNRIRAAQQGQPMGNLQLGSPSVRKETRGLMNQNQDWRAGFQQASFQKAQRLISQLQSRSLATFSHPETQFPLASLYRKLGHHQKADEIYRSFQLLASEPRDDDQSLNFPSDDNAWRNIARAELWFNSPTELPPDDLVLCKSTRFRPRLDGKLDDTCWKSAMRISLTKTVEEAEEARGFAATRTDKSSNKNDQPTPYPYAMLAYDGEFLYLAASLPRRPGMRVDPPKYAGRTHDTDLRSFDRVSLFLDVDRDYRTSYRLDIDQRGWTADTCVGDAGWNPKWFVAADGDAGNWRIEVAIPLKELTPIPPQRNEIWAFSLLRIAPAVEMQSWSHPMAAGNQPASYGWIRFE